MFWKKKETGGPRSNDSNIIGDFWQSLTGKESKADSESKEESPKKDANIIGDFLQSLTGKEPKTDTGSIEESPQKDPDVIEAFEQSSTVKESKTDSGSEEIIPKDDSNIIGDFWQSLTGKESQVAPASDEVPKKKGLFAKLRERLRATSESIAQKAINLFRLRGKIDDELLLELEEILISADVGVHTTNELIKELRNRIRREKKRDSEDSKWLTDTLRSLMREMLEQGDRTLKVAKAGPSIYLIIGVNGVGKTTAIAKMAHRLKNEGKKVLLVAADTFRAAAIEQLEIWAKRAEVPIVLGKERSDPSSVVYNAMIQAKEQTPDAVIIDTAGRLHTKSNLMQELSKMSRVIEREFEGAPQEILLVLDASTGQNALSQARQFMQSCGVTGLILTKLDGTARGGVVLAVHKELSLPVKFIGVGESIEDLEPFNPDAFTKALFQVEGEEDEEELTEAELITEGEKNP